ncbi:hypothetical protein GCM10023325_09440 [Sphingomonas lutea]
MNLKDLAEPPCRSRGWKTHWNPIVDCWYGGARNLLNWGSKHMKKFVFAFVGTAALALAACSGDNQDAVGNAEMNQPPAELNDLSSDAANDAAAAEAAALGTQQQQLEEQNAVDNTANPVDEDEQNVSGM